MLDLKPGDIVELSGAVVLDIAQNLPEAYAAVQARSSVHFPVLSVEEDQVVVNLATEGDPQPLTVRIADPAHPWRSVRLYQRGDSPQPLDESPPIPTVEFRETDVDEVPELAQLLGPGATVVQSRVGPVPPQYLAGVQQAMQAAMARERVPIKVQFAHAVFSQLLAVRYQAAMQAPPVVPGDEWKGETAVTNVRELDDPESKLYVATVRNMVAWLDAEV